jgi:hypothetical protein
VKCLAVDREDSEPDLDKKEDYSDINSGKDSLEEEAAILSNFHPIGSNLEILHPALPVSDPLVLT